MSLDNVIKPSSNLPKYTFQGFPAMFWNQETGESVLVKSENEIPPGYKPYHPNNAPVIAPEVASAGKPTLTKAETIAQLSAGEVEHDPAASHKSLYALLLSSIKNALGEANIDHDANSTDAKGLLELFPKE